MRAQPTISRYATHYPATRVPSTLIRHPISLPVPGTEGGMPLMAALKERRSSRAYLDRPIALQTLSDLLWAAIGINRPNHDRTVPYWRHVMLMDVYLAMQDGVFLYEPETHVLLPHIADDIRALTGTQDFVATAPLNLIYVAHTERIGHISPVAIITRRSMPPSSDRTSTCSAPRPGLRRYSVDRSSITGWRTA